MSITANWTRENLAWAAGLFEGEGSIYPPLNRLTLSSTDKDIVEKFAALVGCGIIDELKPHPGKLGKKTQWRWYCGRQEYSQALLAAFWPWLGSRRKAKAEEFLKRMATAWRNKASKGEKNGNAKLTIDQVRAIAASQLSPAALSTEYGISRHTVWMIRTKKTWSHIHVY